MKRLVILLLIAAIMAGKSPVKKDEYKTLTAIATDKNKFTVNDETIILYNENELIINETYVLLVDPVNDNEVLNYIDLETFELNNHVFIK
ncbi:hypothetical protein J6S88_06235 [bacterium]|nr:hypothetical protein [bacterium]